jgi:hypothetical protein
MVPVPSRNPFLILRIGQADHIAEEIILADFFKDPSEAFAGGGSPFIDSAALTVYLPYWPEPLQYCWVLAAARCPQRSSATLHRKVVLRESHVINLGLLCNLAVMAGEVGGAHALDRRSGDGVSPEH